MIARCTRSVITLSPLIEDAAADDDDRKNRYRAKQIARFQVH